MAASTPNRMQPPSKSAVAMRWALLAVLACLASSSRAQVLEADGFELAPPLAAVAGAGGAFDAAAAVPVDRGSAVAAQGFQEDAAGAADAAAADAAADAAPAESGGVPVPLAPPPSPPPAAPEVPGELVQGAGPRQTRACGPRERGAPPRPLVAKGRCRLLPQVCGGRLARPLAPRRAAPLAPRPRPPPRPAAAAAAGLSPGDAIPGRFILHFQDNATAADAIAG
jgi:hypothetical protein